MIPLLKVVATIGSVIAISALPNFGDDIPSSATHVKTDFAKVCHVGAHKFMLEKTTLADVVHTFGRGVIRGNHQDAAGCETFVDYSDGTNLIRFSSNCEMGGGNLDGVRIVPRFPKDLAGLPRLDEAVVFSFGGCGMSFDELQSRLGMTTRIKGNVSYLFEGKKPIRTSADKIVDYDVIGSLTATISQGKVIALEVFHSTSN